MSQPVIGQPYTGPLFVDASTLAGKLVDIPPGGTARLRTEQEGMDEVIAELAAAAPSLGAVVQEPYDVFVSCTDNLAQIRAARAVVDKLAEVLAESEAKHEHDRENAVSMIVDAARSAARRKGDPAILAAFEKTIGYAAQAAQKAARTRKKNAETKKGGEAGNG